MRSLLTGPALLLLPGLALATFTNPFTPGFRGQPDTEFSGWDFFTSATDPNLPDDPFSTSDDATVTLTTPGGVVTSTGNLYNPGNTPAFVLEDTVPGDLQEVVLQLQIVGFGNPVDVASVLLTYVDGQGQDVVVPPGDLFYQSGGGGLGEIVFTWDLSSSSDVVNAYRIDWQAVAPNHALDAVLLDTRFGGALGTNFCATSLNSTGQPARIGASGSAQVVVNDLELEALPVPAGQPGIFYYGPNTTLVPFGNGFRCVAAGSVGVQRLPVEVADAGGRLAHQVDLDAPPTPAGQILPGSTWHFQAWFRDPVGGGSAFNLSDGLTLTFQ